MLLGNHHPNMVSSISSQSDNCQLNKMKFQQTLAVVGSMQLFSGAFWSQYTKKLSVINFESEGDLLFRKMLKSATKEIFERKWNIQRSEAKNIPFFTFVGHKTIFFGENRKFYRVLSFVKTYPSTGGCLKGSKSLIILVVSQFPQSQKIL